MALRWRSGSAADLRVCVGWSLGAEDQLFLLLVLMMCWRRRRRVTVSSLGIGGGGGCERWGEGGVLGGVERWAGGRGHAGHMEKTMKRSN